MSDINMEPSENLVSSAVPSNLERLDSISRPIRVIRSSSSSPLQLDQRLFKLNHIMMVWFSFTSVLHCVLKSLEIFLSILKNSSNAFLKHQVKMPFEKVLNFPAQFLINSFAVICLVEETLFSTVPERGTVAIIFHRNYCWLWLH